MAVAVADSVMILAYGSSYSSYSAADVAKTLLAEIMVAAAAVAILAASL